MDGLKRELSCTGWTFGFLAAPGVVVPSEQPTNNTARQKLTFTAQKGEQCSPNNILPAELRLSSLVTMPDLQVTQQQPHANYHKLREKYELPIKHSRFTFYVPPRRASELLELLSPVHC